ncbi:MAG: gamma-glutamylcyclotransferase [Gammaproteobacteria bacterium]|nr:gamma-glutamylcyclotransferase [Gammaproteobacteria bacterium]
MSFYFAYGSNMNPHRVTERGIGFDRVSAARAPGFQVRFEKRSRLQPEAGHANLAYSQSGVAEGVLYRLTDDAQIVKMDPYEGVPVHYSRDSILVETERGSTWAWTYFANRAVIASDLKPPHWYVAHMAAGEQYLSAEYTAWLRSVECL